MYTIERKIENDKLEYFYAYTIAELPEFIGYTDYQGRIAKANWIATEQNQCVMKQTNKFYRWTKFIPLVNALVSALWHGKYDLFVNDRLVGYVDNGEALFKRNTHFVIGDEEYYIGMGNTFVSYPNKKYEWPITKNKNEVIVTVKTTKNVGEYLFDIHKNVLDITVIATMIMLTDMILFSGIGKVPYLG